MQSKEDSWNMWIRFTHNFADTFTQDWKRQTSLRWEFIKENKKKEWKQELDQESDKENKKKKKENTLSTKKKELDH